MEAAARPLPREETTPPVTKMYFVATSTVLSLGRVRPLLGPLPHQRRLVRSRARPGEPDPRAVAQQRRPAARGGPGQGGQPLAEERPGLPRPEQPGDRLAGKAEAPEAGGGDLGRLVAHDRERRQLERRRREAAPAEPVEGPGEPRKPG